MDNKNFVRSRILAMRFSIGLIDPKILVPNFGKAQMRFKRSPTRSAEKLSHKLVSRSVNGAKVHGIRRILLQFLPQPQDVIIDGAR